MNGLKSALGMAGGNSMGGVLGTTIGETPTEANARIEEAKKTATDLTGLVRKKNKEATPEPAKTATTGTTNGKRKAENEPEVEAAEAKKAKVEDAPGE